MIANFTKRQRNTHDEFPLGEHTTMVYPTDLDGNIHMNNARYFRELNFARRKYFFQLGLWELATKYSLNFIVRAQQGEMFLCGSQIYERGLRNGDSVL